MGHSRLAALSLHAGFSHRLMLPLLLDHPLLVVALVLLPSFPMLLPLDHPPPSTPR